jgi:outer membrane protein OmpA-like peptidoglycan-associated protein
MTDAFNRWRQVFFCLVVAFLMAGCASQKGLIVLLPEEGRPAGEVTVITANGSQVLNQPWQAVEISGGKVQPTGPLTMNETAVHGIFAEALAAMPVPPICYILYFKVDTVVLTPDSRLLLPEIIKAIKARHPAELSVVGHTDTMGTAEYNYQLGLLRARAVTELLKSLGAAPVIIETSSHGKADLLVKTGDQVSEQRNRRVEVTIR